MMADDDLKVFVDACREFQLRTSIRGSTANLLSGNMDSGSITQNVPPLGDLDLVVRDEQPAEAMRKVSKVLDRYRTYVPASRFIHTDVFYEDLPVHPDSPLGNVVIHNLPEIAIGHSEDKDYSWDPIPSQTDESVRAVVEPRVPETLFRDFLFLLRICQRHPELKETTDEVATRLRRRDPREIGVAIREQGGRRELERIDKLLAKHVLLREPDSARVQMTDYLSPNWLSRLSSQLNPLSRRIISAEGFLQKMPLVAYLVNGKIIEFAEAAKLEVEEEALLKKRLAPTFDSISQKLIPFLKIALPEPDDPDCCDYRDFSKGISELAIRDPKVGPLVDVALIEGREKCYAVHAQASEGFGTRSLRTDPGFMGMLINGSLPTVRLLGVKKQ